MSGRTDGERFAVVLVREVHRLNPIQDWVQIAQATLDHFELKLPPEPSPAEMIARAYVDQRYGDEISVAPFTTAAFAALLEDGTLKAAVAAYEAGGGS